MRSFAAAIVLAFARALVCAVVLALCLPLFAFAHTKEAPKQKQAIVLAAFGSSQPEAAAAIDAVRARLEAAFPDRPVRLALTSRHARATLSAQKPVSPLTALGQLSDQGYNDILVLPLLVSAGEEYQDLKILVNALDALRKTQMNKKPFLRIRLERTLLGELPEGSPADMAEAAKALAGDAAQARERGAALVYAAHGNGQRQAQEMVNFQAALRKASPGQTIAVATLESTPGLAEVLKTLEAAKTAAAKKAAPKPSAAKTGAGSQGKVLLLPLLMTSGVHVADDVCGAEKDSWRSVLEQAGYAVECQARGLGQVDAVAELFVRRARLALEK